MTQQKVVDLKEGLAKVQAAVQVRQEITALYERYHLLAQAANHAASISAGDFKLAVDALHCLGGDQPSENSKGRMERLLDNFFGMYRVMDFIGRGQLVTDYLSKFGITVNLNPEFAIANIELSPVEVELLQREYNIGFYGIDNPKDLRELITGLVLACEMLQGAIHLKAHQIKDALEPTAQSKLGVADEEYDRICDAMWSTVGEVTTSSTTKRRL